MITVKDIQKQAKVSFASDQMCMYLCLNFQPEFQMYNKTLTVTHKYWSLVEQ